MNEIKKAISLCGGRSTSWLIASAFPTKPFINLNENRWFLLNASFLSASPWGLLLFDYQVFAPTSTPIPTMVCRNTHAGVATLILSSPPLMGSSMIPEKCQTPKVST